MKRRLLFVVVFLSCAVLVAVVVLVGGFLATAGADRYFRRNSFSSTFSRNFTSLTS
jgi:hypothetical protein